MTLQEPVELEGAKVCVCVCAYMCPVDHHMVITDVSGVVTIDKQ